MNEDDWFKMAKGQQDRLNKVLKSGIGPSKFQTEYMKQIRSLTRKDNLIAGPQTVGKITESPAVKQALAVAKNPNTVSAIENFDKLPAGVKQKKFSDLIKGANYRSNDRLKQLSDLIGVPGAKLTADQLERLNRIRSIKIPTNSFNENSKIKQNPEFNSRDDYKNETGNYGNPKTDVLDDLDWNLAIREAENYATIYDNLNEDRSNSKLSQNVNDIPQQPLTISDAEHLLSSIWSAISVTSDTFETFKTIAEAIGFLIWLLHYFHIV
ncbi:hypothetical protein [Secundilactobacillus kimchicus]|uniref:hypothetical protein n=1 Tax=Secundilactobacillus kimchicus TaxID=528209 RepID=UPI0024A9E7FE|nr:hypothetical protein [Secundilactobacillus kimchicus]